MWWFNIHVLCEMVTTIRLISTSITSHSYLLLFVVWMLKMYSFSQGQVYISELLTVITMLCCMSLCHTYSSYNCWFLYFEAPLFGACTFWITTTSGCVDRSEKGGGLTDPPRQLNQKRDTWKRFSMSSGRRPGWCTLELAELAPL